MTPAQLARQDREAREHFEKGKTDLQFANSDLTRWYDSENAVQGQRLAPGLLYRIKPALQYRPYNFDELPNLLGKKVTAVLNAGTSRVVVAATSEGVCLGGLKLAVPPEDFLVHYKQLSGEPCGVKVD